MKSTYQRWILVLVALGLVTLSLLVMTRMYLELRRTWTDSSRSALLLDLARSDIQWIRLQLQDEVRLDFASLGVRVDQAFERYQEALLVIENSFPYLNLDSVDSLPNLLPQLKTMDFTDPRSRETLLTRFDTATEFVTLELSFEIKRFLELRDRLNLVVLWISAFLIFHTANLVFKSYDQREKLLRELQHRTNNTMQVLQSWIQSRIIDEDNTEVANSLKEVYHLSYCMSLASKIVHRDPSLSAVPLREFVGELFGVLIGGYEIPRENTALVVDDCSILIDYAVPLGIVLTELVSFSKEGGPNSHIDVRLEKDENEDISFFYMDRSLKVGVIGADQITTIQGLALDQLKGKLQIQLPGERKDFEGFSLSLTFTPKGYTVRL